MVKKYKETPLTIESFLFELPLYTTISFEDQEEYNKLCQLITFSGAVEGYNCTRREPTTYQISLGNTPPGFKYDSIQNGVYEMIASCKRFHDKVRIWYLVMPIPVPGQQYSVSAVQKIGQYPSIADLHISKVKEFGHFLDRRLLKEFTRAIGLAANGVGIGSFVYLRRIFETLVESARIEVSTQGDPSYDESTYWKSRIPERIKMLKGYLPVFLVQNCGIYSILSKGIHELDEEECLAYFPILRESIELILDEKVETLNKAMKIEKVSKTLNAINQRVK